MKDNSDLHLNQAFSKVIWRFLLKQKLHWIVYILHVLFTSHKFWFYSDRKEMVILAANYFDGNNALECTSKSEFIIPYKHCN